MPQAVLCALGIAGEGLQRPLTEVIRKSDAWSGHSCSSFDCKASVILTYVPS